MKWGSFQSGEEKLLEKKISESFEGKDEEGRVRVSKQTGYILNCPVLEYKNPVHPAICRYSKRESLDEACISCRKIIV
jgi:hypothetical protein